jgi:site-specific recombinase XerD
MLDKIAEWIDWLRIDSAATTVEAYGWELRRLERWCAPREVIALSRADLARYLAERRVLGECSDATVRRSTNALKAFYLFALGKRSPAKSLPIPGVKKKRQRTLDFQDAFRLIASLDTSGVKGKRDLAIICLGLSSGLRSSELCRLGVSEVDLQRGRLTTRVKGGNDGDGVFGYDTAAALASWLSIRETIAAVGVKTMFVSIGGTTHGQPITPSGLRCIFRSIGKKSGLEQGLSPHDLRRSFATLSSRLGAPSRIVQVAGRWSDLKMVEGYTQALEADDFVPYDPVSKMLGLGGWGTRKVEP